MAIATPTSLIGNVSAADQSSYTIASATYTAGRLYLVFVASALASGNTPTISGTNTYTQIPSATVQTDNRRLTAFECLATSTATETLTIGFGGQTQSGCVWSVIEIASGFDSGNPVGLSNTADGIGTAASCDVGTIDADSVVVGGVSHGEFEGIVPGDNELFDNAATPPHLTLETQYAAAGDDTISGTVSAGSFWRVVVVEINAAVAGGARKDMLLLGVG